MKKSLITLTTTALIAATMSMIVYAAEWKQDTTGWWYEQDGGGYATGWNWIDGKCYYFVDNGYMAVNTEVDGYTLNADGQWTVDGVVQTKEENSNQTTFGNGRYTSYKLSYMGINQDDTTKVIDLEEQADGSYKVTDVYSNGTTKDAIYTKTDGNVYKNVNALSYDVITSYLYVEENGEIQISTESRMSGVTSVMYYRK